MQIDTIFFDLDETLYRDDNGLWDLMVGRIRLFMLERVGIREREADELRMEYLGKYGTTLRGLHVHYQVDPQEYLEFVHDIPVEKHIKRNGELERMLQGLPQAKWIWTNASEAHAERVLTALGVRGHFRGIIDIEEMQFQNKPQLAAYTTALKMAEQFEIGRALFIDDRVVNLEPAADLGARTVWVGSQEPHPAADFSIQHVEELIQVMPELARRQDD
jgi:putative hydrolase of the HAD superfamily